MYAILLSSLMTSASRLFGASVRSMFLPVPKLVRSHDTLALGVRLLTEGRTSNMALMACVFAAVSTAELCVGTSKRTSLELPPLVASFTNTPEYKLQTNDRYASDVNTSPVIELSFIGDKRHLRELPRALGSLATFLEATGLDGVWPYIYGVTHDRMATIAQGDGWRVDTIRPGSKNTTDQAGFSASMARATEMVRNQTCEVPTEPVKLSAVTMATIDFVQKYKPQ